MKIDVILELDVTEENMYRGCEATNKHGQTKHGWIGLANDAAKKQHRFLLWNDNLFLRVADGELIPTGVVIPRYSRIEGEQVIPHVSS